jgi:valyl-tRNA synthetase
MIMAGLEFTGQVPFRDVYIHGLVRDKLGRKMSKSLGNGIDPLEMIKEHGSDALKFTLGFLCAQGQDILVDSESFKLGSRYANKIWNASRYILGNLEGRDLVPVTDGDLTGLDKWIYARLNITAGLIRTALEGYRYNDAASALYEFFWSDFCDWYVEATKLSFRNGDNTEKNRAVSVLLNVLEESLRLLHPYLPFVTEEIYGKLPDAVKKAPMLIAAPYPVPLPSRENAAELEKFAVLQDLIRAVRALRADCGISPDVKLNLSLKITQGSPAEVSRTQVELIRLLAGANDIGFDEKPAKAIGAAGNGFEVFLRVDGAVNEAQLLARFKKEYDSEKAFADRTQAKLAGSFTEKAPPEVVAAEREKLEKAQEHAGKLLSYIHDLQADAEGTGK